MNLLLHGMHGRMFNGEAEVFLISKRKTTYTSDLDESEECMVHMANSDVFMMKQVLSLVSSVTANL